MEELITGQAIYTDGRHYYDKNGTELNDKDTIVTEDGTYMTVYRTEGGDMGVDATNPAWLVSGRAWPCQFGLYPLPEEVCATAVKSPLIYKFQRFGLSYSISITYDDALYRVLARYVDCDLTRDMLTRCNNIRLEDGFIHVTKPSKWGEMALMAGYENFVPEGYEYDENGKRIKGGE